jgi:hypothetical protein
MYWQKNFKLCIFSKKPVSHEKRETRNGSQFNARALG